MKKNLIFFAAIGIMVASVAACSKENPETAPEVKTAMVPCCIQASTGEVTKTHISGIESGKANIAWDNGDNISVFSTNVSGAGNNQFTISNIEGGKAEFSGEVEDGTTSLVAVYPYSEGLSYSGGTISGAVIPTTQSATANSFVNGASIALAKGTKTVGDPSVSKLTFSNLCAVIGFTLPSNITFADQVVVTANSGANIAGKVSINATTPAITSADAASVTVNGTFTGGNTYYICIAPGTYTDGFNFAISTTGGNSYTRSTTKDATLAAGGLYTLGKLSLALPDDSFTPSVSVSHNVSGGILNGSTATFSMTSNVPDEFDTAIKSVTTNVSISKGNKTYRTCTATGKSVDDIEMTISSGCPYVPSGCTYTADITYVLYNGEKDVERSIQKTGDVTWPAPSGMAIDATLAGYTSYDTYKSSGATEANKLDGSTIYDIGASYMSGLSSDVETQSDKEGLLTITSTLDGAKDYELTEKSWKSYKIGAKWSFDNNSASGTCASTKTVYVTGLPYTVDTDGDDGSESYTFYPGWTKYGSDSSWGFNDTYDRVCWAEAEHHNTTYTAWGYSPAFNIPSSVGVILDVQCRAFKEDWIDAVKMYVGNQYMESPTPLSEPDAGKTTPGMGLDMNDTYFTFSLEPSHPNVWIYAYFKGIESTTYELKKWQWVEVEYWPFTSGNMPGIYTGDISIKYND